MKDSWRHFIAEFIGTFALVFVGSAAIIRGGTLLEVAIAHGIVLSIMVTALMRISGHFNPAVTLAFLTVRRIEPVMAVVYIIAQILGATAAAYALKGLMPANLSEATRGGGQ